MNVAWLFAIAFAGLVLWGAGRWVLYVYRLNEWVEARDPYVAAIYIAGSTATAAIRKRSEAELGMQYGMASKQSLEMLPHLLEVHNLGAELLVNLRKACGELKLWEMDNPAPRHPYKREKEVRGPQSIIERMLSSDKPKTKGLLET